MLAVVMMIHSLDLPSTRIIDVTSLRGQAERIILFSTKFLQEEEERLSLLMKNVSYITV